jgi:prepilin-type N-terminal cleavage/methylation domain-containing protein
MKAPTKKHSANGFTLIELLVVIAIIAVLAAAGFGVGIAAKERAKRLSAQAGATAIANAVEQFYTEYSALPDPSGTASADTEYTTTSATGRTLLEILSATGVAAVVTDQNPRKIKFLSYKQAKNDMDGLVYSADGTAIEDMFDPWGQPFYIRLDFDYDERLSFTPQNNPAVTLNGRKVAVYSLGVKKPVDANPSKFVKTW